MPSNTTPSAPFVPLEYTGPWPLHDWRYHLTDEGRRILALLPTPKEDAR